MAKAKQVKSTAVVVRKGDYLPANIRDEIERAAQEDEARVKVTGGGAFMSVSRDGQFVFDSAEIGAYIDVVILSFAHLNEYYDKPYNPKAKGETPACYAIGTNEDALAPAANAPDAQSTRCAGCEQAEFGSATQGAGRACKQKMRLAFISVDSLKQLKELQTTPIIQLRTPPMAKLEFNKYIKVVLGDPNNRRHCATVITRISAAKNARYNDSLTLHFDALADVPGALVAPLWARRKEATDLVLAEIPIKAAESRDSGRAAAPPAKTSRFAKLT